NRRSPDRRCAAASSVLPAASGIIAARLLCFLDFDLALGLDCLRFLCRPYSQHTLVELGLYRAFIDRFWQADRALKATEAALTQVVVLALLLLLVLLLALDGQHPVGKAD